MLLPIVLRSSATTDVSCEHVDCCMEDRMLVRNVRRILEYVQVHRTSAFLGEETYHDDTPSMEYPCTTLEKRDSMSILE